MNTKQLPILLLSLLMAGCSANSSAPQNTEPAAAVETAAESQTQETADAAPEQNIIDGLIENEYEGLEITAAVLPGNAMLPGLTIPVTVTITNNGDKTISYVQGSGSFQIPQSLTLKMEKLQPILPVDHLGAVTMDFVTKELKPDEQIQFVINVRAIEPNKDFDTYTYDLKIQEQQYIGDLDIEQLTDKYPDLVPAAAGTYDGTALFLYHTIDPETGASLFGEATGYIQTQFAIHID